MSLRPRTLLPLAGLLFLAFVTPAGAQAPAAPADARKKDVSYIRLRRDAQGQPVALQTAVVRFAPASGRGDLVVDLIGAVHVGDKAYYRALNDKMAGYDVLLYELVAPEGTRIPKGGKRDGGLANFLQTAVKMALDLDLQTEQIDYTPKHFVHADLSPGGIAEAVRKRGDDGLTLTLSIAADFLRQQNLQEMKRQNAAAKEEEGDLLALLLDADGPVKMKKMLAEQLAASGAEAGLGPTLSNILIADRNQAALKVFQKELANGKKKVGIFYGAAHMPDFEKRLQEDFGLKRTGEEWVTAWDLKPRKKGLEELLKLLDR